MRWHGTQVNLSLLSISLAFAILGHKFHELPPYAQGSKLLASRLRLAIPRGLCPPVPLCGIVPQRGKLPWVSEFASGNPEGIVPSTIAWTSNFSQCWNQPSLPTQNSVRFAHFSSHLASPFLAIQATPTQSSLIPLKSVPSAPERPALPPSRRSRNRNWARLFQSNPLKPSQTQ